MMILLVQDLLHSTDVFEARRCLDGPKRVEVIFREILKLRKVIVIQRFEVNLPKRLLIHFIWFCFVGEKLVDDAVGKYADFGSDKRNEREVAS